MNDLDSPYTNPLVLEGGDQQRRANWTSQPASSQDVSSWYEAMARAWGETLDRQAQVISDLSNEIGSGGLDQPSSVVQLTAESLKMQFMSNNANTANNSVGQALETLGKRQ